MASPNLVQTAPSWAGSLEARQVWARLAPGRAASRKELCQIRALSGAGALPYWRRTRLHPSKACSSRRLGCLLLLLAMSFNGFRRARGRLSKGLLVGLMVWSLTEMTHAAMRFAAISFFFALPLAALYLDIEEEQGP